MKKTIFCLLFSACSLTAIHAQSKTEKIRELLSLTKTEKMSLAILDNFKAVLPETSMFKDDARKDSLYNGYLRTEMQTIMKQGMDKRVVDIYEKYYTIEEIQKYIDFYKTPEGQKLLDTMPLIMKDLMSGMMEKDFPDMKERMTKKIEEIKAM